MPCLIGRKSHVILISGLARACARDGGERGRDIKSRLATDPPSTQNCRSCNNKPSQTSPVQSVDCQKPALTLAKASSKDIGCRRVPTASSVRPPSSRPRLLIDTRHPSTSNSLQLTPTRDPSVSFLWQQQLRLLLPLTKTCSAAILRFLTDPQSEPCSCRRSTSPCCCSLGSCWSCMRTIQWHPESSSVSASTIRNLSLFLTSYGVSLGIFSQPITGLHSIRRPSGKWQCRCHSQSYASDSHTASHLLSPEIDSEPALFKWAQTRHCMQELGTWTPELSSEPDWPIPTHCGLYLKRTGA